MKPTEIITNHKKGETKIENTDINYPCPLCGEFFRIFNTTNMLSSASTRIERRAKELRKVRARLVTELTEIKNQKYRLNSYLTRLNPHLSEEECQKIISISWSQRMEDLYKCIGQYNIDCKALNKEIDDFRDGMYAWDKDIDAFSDLHKKLKQEGQPFFDINLAPERYWELIMQTKISFGEQIYRIDKQSLENIIVD